GGNHVVAFDSVARVGGENAPERVVIDVVVRHDPVVINHDAAREIFYHLAVLDGAAGRVLDGDPPAGVGADEDVSDEARPGHDSVVAVSRHKEVLEQDVERKLRL